MTNQPGIPRALSTDTTDPRYRTNYMEIASKLIIWLDDVEQRLVSTYDLDEGFVVRAVPDSDGQVQINPGVPDEVLVEKVHGKVAVTIKDEAA